MICSYLARCTENLSLSVKKAPSVELYVGKGNGAWLLGTLAVWVSGRVRLTEGLVLSGDSESLPEPVGSSGRGDVSCGVL